MWRPEDPQGNEAAKCRWDLVPYTAGQGLDLGCGPFKAFPHFIGVDNGHHWGTDGADISVKTCEDLSIFGTESMDFVFSSHLLEHIQDTKSALAEWYRVIKDGGYLILYLPHKEYYPNVGQKGSNPDHKHDFMPDDIISIMRDVGFWNLIENEERNGGREYSFFQVYRKGGDSHRMGYLEEKPAKTCAVIRYGAFGDLIQTASLLPGLKAQGYNITLYTTDVGYMVTKHDPHIDSFVIQGKDQIPNPALGVFWDHLRTKFDKVVNLSESTEATLLSIDGRINHTWPHQMRQKYMNTNYLEFMHDLAEIPLSQDAEFYPSEKEKTWALEEKEKMGGKVILWSLAGSAVHKTWPYLDTIIARLMTRDDSTRVVLVGDELCKLLEEGWEEEPRVFCRSGVWSIRQSLAFAQVADLVIGPETGVLNAVCNRPLPKIVCLSHSSKNNLTRDWINTISLEPENTPCFPCHKMHYNFDFCHRGETGVALCQENISADSMYSAVLKQLEG